MPLGSGRWCSINNAPAVVFGITVVLQIDEVIEFFGYLDIMIWPLIALGQIVSMRSRSKASLKRITAFLDTEVVVKSPENAIVLENAKGNISYRHFSFHYPNYDASSLTDILLRSSNPIFCI